MAWRHLKLACPALSSDKTWPAILAGERAILAQSARNTIAIRVALRDRERPPSPLCFERPLARALRQRLIERREMAGFPASKEMPRFPARKYTGSRFDRPRRLRKRACLYG